MQHGVQLTSSDPSSICTNQVIVGSQDVDMGSPPPPLRMNDSTAHAKSIPQTQPNVDNSVLKHVTSGKLLNHVSCRSSVFDSDVSVLVLFSLQYYLLLE